VPLGFAVITIQLIHALRRVAPHHLLSSSNLYVIYFIYISRYKITTDVVFGQRALFGSLIKASSQITYIFGRVHFSHANIVTHRTFTISSLRSHSIESIDIIPSSNTAQDHRKTNNYKQTGNSVLTTSPITGGAEIRYLPYEFDRF